MDTVNVSLRGLFQDATAFAGYIQFELSRPALAGDTVVLAASPFAKINLKAGLASVRLIPNAVLGKDTFYRFRLFRVDMRGRTGTEVLKGVCVVPEQDCDLTDIMDVKPGYADLPTAEKYASEAKYAAVQASKAGESAQDAAEAAGASEQTAAQKAAEAESAKTDAEASASAASMGAASAQAAAQAAAQDAEEARASASGAEAARQEAAAHGAAAEANALKAETVSAEAEAVLEQVKEMLASGSDYATIFLNELEA